MPSQSPVDFNKLKKAELNNGILRAAIIGWLRPAGRQRQASSSSRRYVVALALRARWRYGLGFLRTRLICFGGLRDGLFLGVPNFEPAAAIVAD
jgi:hypothetical protein